MTGAARLDACRDAAALIRATASRDHEAQQVILDYSDNRELARVLAILAATGPRPRLPRRTVPGAPRPRPGGQPDMTVTTTEQRLLDRWLLATDAAVAERPAGPCALCHHGILRGDRYAALVPSGKLAHIACTGRLALRQRIKTIR
jgi:hypothetical protein